jgi:hypothetical protein
MAGPGGEIGGENTFDYVGYLPSSLWHENALGEEKI